MPEDPTSRALFLMMLAAALCMVGMLTIWLLAIVWRRYNRRLDASRRMPAGSALPRMSSTTSTSNGDDTKTMMNSTHSTRMTGIDD